MPNDNEQIIRGGYDAFAQGDIPAVLGMLSDQIVWHIPGRSPLSGDYNSNEEVVGFFGKSMELSGGTLKVEVDELLSDGDRVVALTTVSARRNGTSWSAPEVHVWRVVDGRATEFREYQGDQQTEDEFWSS
jgi:ketosteroid isomerase-like protein